ncbi:MAG: hypothetical protein NZ959_11840 [Armatimonadetes bacterium]|nr:hypothetical protein [Armatimonadota bacterium]MDW8122675.1 hypothetical protein [Armatimonadota bacterium]
MQREIPIWMGIVAVVVVILIVAGIFYLRRPRVQEGMAPPPEAPVGRIGPALGTGQPGQAPAPAPQPGGGGR